MKLITLPRMDEPCLTIEEQGDASVSNYSNFLISNMPSTLEGKVVCDYGSGTGVVGLCACVKGADKVVAIEINPHFRELTMNNTKLNSKQHLIELYENKDDFEKRSNCLFDFIFCNPASLPKLAGSSSFYNGGEFGLDMILEVVNFTSSFLKKDGHLIILVTSILPTSLFFEELSQLKMNHTILNTVDLKFREHYKGIQLWVDENQIQYPEMQYFNSNGVLHERVIAYDVVKKEALPTKTTVTEALDKSNIPYVIKKHQKVALTCEDAARERGVRITQIIKCMLGSDPQENVYVMLIPGDKTLKIKKLRQLIGGVKVELIPSDMLPVMFGVIVGAISPIQFLGRAKFFLDKTVLLEDVIDISSGSPEAGVELKTSDLVNLLKPTICDIISDKS